MDKIKTVKRTINYFELKFKTESKSSSLNFIDLFSRINSLSKGMSHERFITNNEKQLYLTGIEIDTSSQLISGKLLNIRMENFPELMNMKDDAIRDIDADDEEGIIETSHFLLSFMEHSCTLSFEFNQFGPRINDFILSLQHFLLKFELLFSIDYNPLVRDDLDKYKKRIHRVSSVVAKVHKDNIKRINEFDKELFDAIATAYNISEAEYVSLELKYDFKKMADTPSIRKKVLNVINRLISHKDSCSVFNKFIVVAEDKNQNFKLKQFDLLNIWIKTEIKVEKKPKSRVIISNDIFSKMKIEFNKEFQKR